MIKINECLVYNRHMETGFVKVWKFPQGFPMDSPCYLSGVPCWFRDEFPKITSLLSILMQTFWGNRTGFVRMRSSFLVKMCWFLRNACGTSSLNTTQRLIRQQATVVKKRFFHLFQLFSKSSRVPDFRSVAKTESQNN